MTENVFHASPIIQFEKKNEKKRLLIKKNKKNLVVKEVKLKVNVEVAAGRVRRHAAAW